MDILDTLIQASGFLSLPASFWTGLGIATPIVGGGIRFAFSIDKRIALTERKLAELDSSVSHTHEIHGQKLDKLMEGMARIEGELKRDR